MTTLTVSFDVDYNQLAAISWQANLQNKTVDQFLEDLNVDVASGLASQRSAARRAKGLELYSAASEETKATVDSELGLSPDYPTGNE